jgi:TPR repeat protein
MPRKSTKKKEGGRPAEYTIDEVRKLERSFLGEKEQQQSDPVPQGQCIDYAMAALRSCSEVSRDLNVSEFRHLCLAFYWLYAAVENSGGANSRAKSIISDLLRDYYDSILGELADLDGLQKRVPGEQAEDGSDASIIDLLDSRRRGGMRVPGSEKDDQDTLNFIVSARLTAIMGELMDWYAANGGTYADDSDLPPFVPEECALLMRFHEPLFADVDVPDRRPDVLRYKGPADPDFAGQIADDVPPQDNDSFSELSATLIVDFFERMRSEQDKVLLSGFGVPAEAATLIALGYLNGRDMAFSLEKAGFWLRYAMALGSPRAWLLHAVFFSKVGRSYLTDADGTGYTMYVSDLMQAAKLCWASHQAESPFFRHGPRPVTYYDEGGGQASIMASAINSLVNAALTLREVQLDRGHSRPELAAEISMLFDKALHGVPVQDPALCAAAAGLALLTPERVGSAEFRKIWNAWAEPGRSGKVPRMPKDPEDFSSGLIRALMPEHQRLVEITGQGISDSSCKAHRKVLEKLAADGFAKPLTLIDEQDTSPSRIELWRMAAELGSPLASCNYAYILLGEGRPADAEKPALAALRGGIPQAYYVLAKAYLSSGKTELGCTCMRYAACYMMPEARALVETLKSHGLYKPLPYMKDLDELEELAETDRTACSILSAMTMCGAVLPRDRVRSLKLMNDCVKMGDSEVAGQISYLTCDIWHDVPGYACVPDMSEALNCMYRFQMGFLGMADEEGSGEKAVGICRRMLKHLDEGKTWLEKGIRDQLKSGGGWAWMPTIGEPKGAAPTELHGLLALCEDYMEILTEERSGLCGGKMDDILVSESGWALDELCKPEALCWRRVRAECALFTALRGLGGVRLDAARRFAVEGFNCGSVICGVILGTSLAPAASDLGRSFRDENLLDSDTLLVPEMDQ